MKNTFIFAIMAMFMLMFSPESKAQVQLVCTHDFRDFVVSGGCTGNCDCSYTFISGLSTSSPTLVTIIVNGTFPVSLGGSYNLMPGDVICFMLQYANGDREECCFDDTDWCQ